VADAGTRPARILVVDDELYNRELMVRTFARGSEVVAAGDALEAAAVLERWAADVLVTDFLLGTVDGVELARRVRARWPAMRIVVVTGFDGDPELVAAHADGTVDDVVAKPWAPSALRTRVLALVVR
jgi:CheY-like chemotaxis protein